MMLLVSNNQTEREKDQSEIDERNYVMEEFHYFLLLGQKAQNRPPTNNTAAAMPTQFMSLPGFGRSSFRSQISERTSEVPFPLGA